MGRSKKMKHSSQRTTEKKDTSNVRTVNGGNIYKNYSSNYPRQGTFRQGAIRQMRNPSRYPHKPLSRFNQSNYAGEVWINKKYSKKLPSRPPSPVQGSEEYMDKKIKETSAIIMMQLLNPDIQFSSVNNRNEEQSKEKPNKSSHKTDAKVGDKPETSTKGKNKKASLADIEQIHKKILNHITNLNDGRKKNLINSGTSGYDVAIRLIQQQKRLEISRAFRDMCSRSNQSLESSQFINSIIPDIGIKVEELPRDLLEELRNTLNNDFANFDDEFWNMNSSGAVNPTIDDQLGTNLNPSCVVTNNDNITTASRVVDTINIKRNVLQSNNRENLQITEQVGSKELSNPDSEKGVSDNSNSNIGTSAIGNNNIIENKHKEDHTETLPQIQVKTEPDDNSKENNVGCIMEDDLVQNKDEEMLPQIHVKSEPVDDSAENNGSSVMEGNSDTNLEVDEFAENKISCNDANATDKVINEFKPDKYINIECERRKPDKYINIECDGIETTTEDEFQINNDTNLLTSISTQTDEESESVMPGAFIEAFLKSCFKDPPESPVEVVERSLKIDECISQLTNYRQNLLKNFIKLIKTPESITNITTKNNVGAETKILTNVGTKVRHNRLRIRREERDRVSRNNVEGYKRRVRKRKVENAQSIKDESSKVKKIEVVINDIDDLVIDVKETGSETTAKNNPSRSENLIKKTSQPNLLDFQDVHEKMLVIKVYENVLVAGAESGKLFYCSMENGHYMHILEVTTYPITSLLFRNVAQDNNVVYIGSYETKLKIYNFENHRLLKSVDIEDSIQCMEKRWDYIFIGCIRGSLIRYSLKKEAVEYEVKLSDDRILVLKATQEGARRVLLLGSRNAPVCIRDAMTGLHMRTMENIVSPTTYSLIIKDNLVYCGTTSHNILVFSFYDGKLLQTYDAASAKGIGCMKIIENLLFASCHNGNIYVYDIKKNFFIGSIKGPGSVILAMELLENQVIVSTMLFKFKSLPIPQHILKHKLKQLYVPIVN